MGRHKKDNRLEDFKYTLIGEIVEEKQPEELVNLLVAYDKLLDILEKNKKPVVIDNMEKMKAKAQFIARKAFPIVQPCSKSDCTKLGERHHDDYTKPLEIMWLCLSHHAQRHAELDLD